MEKQMNSQNTSRIFECQRCSQPKGYVFGLYCPWCEHVIQKYGDKTCWPTKCVDKDGKQRMTWSRRNKDY